MISTDSASRSRRSPNPVPKSSPNAACSSSNQPPPSPRIARPPLMWSTVVASFAVSPGLRNVFAATRRPSRARVVTRRDGRERRPALELRGRRRRPRRPGGGRRSRGRRRRRPRPSSTASRSDGQSVRWTQNAAPIRTGWGAMGRCTLGSGHRRDAVRSGRCRPRRPCRPPRAPPSWPGSTTAAARSRSVRRAIRTRSSCRR